MSAIQKKSPDVASGWKTYSLLSGSTDILDSLETMV